MNQKQLVAMCRCGKVKFEAIGPPILTALLLLHELPGSRTPVRGSWLAAPPVLDSDSGTGFVLYRKDRVQCTMGPAVS